MIFLCTTVIDFDTDLFLCFFEDEMGPVLKNV